DALGVQRRERTIALENHREDRTHAPRARRSSRADAGRRKRTASKRWSTRNFGEYAFLEDSRYASQAKNARGKNSQTVATVNSSELGKSAPSAAPATPPRREHRGDRVTAAGLNRDFATMPAHGDI